jgi:predicted secreted protein
MRLLRKMSARVRGKIDFHDNRSRRVILLPHCALNQNARSAGAAERPAAVAELVTGLLNRNIGIIQMPCPEICALGLVRGEVRLEKEMRTPSARAISRSLAKNLAEQIRMYLDSGIQIVGIFGKNGSPSCGVEETWANGVCEGKGAFIEELAAEISEQGFKIEIAGIRDNKPDEALAIADKWLSGLKP